jgi:DNA-binding XRE family transcriptional regulator
MMMDLQCKKCKHRYGFSAPVGVKPVPCPKCGTFPDAAVWEKDQKEIAGFVHLLNMSKNGTMDAADWRKARETSGLTLEQAAKLMDVRKEEILTVEDPAGQKPTIAFVQRLIEAYGLEQFEPRKDQKDL